jgi:cysteine-rich repeat protein
MGKSTADWSNDVCATEFLRIGLRTYEANERRKQRDLEADAAFQADLIIFDTNHPQIVTHDHCGNGTTDVEFGEECDDGGVQTATCEVTCRTPECGDGILNTLAGEACDDFNTSDGDGCSATCTIE